MLAAMRCASCSDAASWSGSGGGSADIGTSLVDLNWPVPRAGPCAALASHAFRFVPCRRSRADPIRADLGVSAECARLVAATAAWRGRLDALVNNASSFRRTPIEEIDEAAWHELVDGNLKASLFTSQAATPWLRTAGGAIVNLCDV